MTSYGTAAPLSEDRSREISLSKIVEGEDAIELRLRGFQEWMQATSASMAQDGVEVRVVLHHLAYEGVDGDAVGNIELAVDDLGGIDLPAIERGPVSYTHLDVYKRQMFLCAFSYEHFLNDRLPCAAL